MPSFALCAVPGVGMAIRDVTINGKPIKLGRLEAAADDVQDVSSGC